MQFKLNYQRVKKPNLEKMETQYAKANGFDGTAYDYNPFRIASLQSYNPIYNLFFNMDSTTSQKITLNHQHLATSLDSVVNSKNESFDAAIFVKSSPLLDPLHFLRGKYDLENPLMRQLPLLESTADTCFPKLLDANNSAYVDGFFSYLTSMMHETHGWIHGVQYYGSFLGIQSRFRYNIADDIEFLEDSEYFLKNRGKYFDLDEDAACIFNEKMGPGSRRNRDKLTIVGDDAIDLGVEDLGEENSTIENSAIENSAIENSTIENSAIENSAIENSAIEDSAMSTPAVVDENINTCVDEIVSSINSTNGHVNVRSRTSSTSSSDSSLVSDSTEDDAEKENICGPDADADDNNDNDDGSDNYTDYTDSEEKLFAYLHDFPVQLIFQEKCIGTFDDLLMRNQTSSQEIIAALFQITIILATYQKMFNFTHNDLHTNNIMYIKTDLEYIHYKLNDTIYKVPTHGRIFKLIDFGRAIYQFNGHQFCSDSFAENGDANTQYNCEPYMNPKKPRIDPNPSFDLCRLGCSLYDFTMDSESKELKTLVDSWCEDDYGKNILYKSSGEERYPGFKLYKMIARCVNNLVPKDILCQPIFAKYRLADLDDQTPLIDIDAMPTYMSNHK